MTQANNETQEQDGNIHLFVEAKFSDAPEWIPLLPSPGVYPHSTFGSVDLSPEAIDKYVANFNAGVYGQKNIPVDLEHDHPLSGAMGYMRELRTNVNGSVDARVEWNERGKTVLNESRFSYVSPTLRTSWNDPVDFTQHDNVIVGAALTTRPHFKEQSLRPLIVASEPKPSPVEGKPMTVPENLIQPAGAITLTQPANDGKAIVDLKFGEKIADLESQVRTFSDDLKNVREENTRLKTEAEARAFREEVVAAKWPGDVDDHVANLQEMSEEGKERYRKQMTTAKNQLFVESRKPVGSDAIGVGATDAETAIAKRTGEIRASEPSLSLQVARARATEQVFNERPELYQDLRAN
jgi:hypothetical protein